MDKIAYLQILIFLIPGFIAEIIVNHFVVRKEKKELSSIIEALILSILIYFVHSLFYYDSPIIFKQISENTFAYSYNKISLLTLISISIILSLLISYIISNDKHMEIARKFKLTKRTSRPSVWLDAFYNSKTHVVINFSDGRRLYGWPEYFSDDHSEPYIYLYKPRWVTVDDNGKSIYVDLEENGILVTPEYKISYIEFLNE